MKDKRANYMKDTIAVRNAARANPKTTFSRDLPRANSTPGLVKVNKLRGKVDHQAIKSDVKKKQYERKAADKAAIQNMKKEIAEQQAKIKAEEDARRKQ